MTMTNGKLPKEFKEKWLRALRSGYYKQGRDQLMKNNDRGKGKTYCCLGVAANICGNTSVLPSKGYMCDLSTQHFKNIPIELTDAYSDVDDDHPISVLIEMNDEGSSFREIANYIEEKL